jgi:hypothetical protein
MALKPLTSVNFLGILVRHGIIVNKNNPISQEGDLGDKFEVVARYCLAMLNHKPPAFNGFAPDFVMNVPNRVCPVRFLCYRESTIHNGVFIEAKLNFGPLSGRAIIQGQRMISYLATQHAAYIKSGRFLPALMYVTTADAVIPKLLITQATNSKVLMAQYTIGYEELGKDVQFGGLTILPLNPGLLVHNTKEGKPATSVFTPLFARPKLSDMRASLSWTRQGG